MASNGVGEVRHGSSPVVDVCRERGIGSPDVVGGRSFEAGERGPLLCQRRRDGKFGRLFQPACSRDRQRKDLGICGISGDPQRSVGSVDFPQEPGAAGDCLADVDARDGSGGERADHRDLVR